MATVNTDLPSITDVMAAVDGRGARMRVVEALKKRSAALQDAVWVESNEQTGHTFTSRTALPTVAWRRFNQGVSPSKSRASTLTETCGMCEGASQVDVKLANLNGDAAAYRAGEDLAFVQSFNHEIETGIFYHSTRTAPEKFMGLSPRLDVSTGVGGSQIIKCDAAAAGNDQTSIWLVAWSPDTVFMIYPRGSAAGLASDDMGKQWIDDGSGTGKKYRAWVTHWGWDVGLAVKDWRYLVRIANVDTSLLAANGTTVIEAMIKAYHQLQDTVTGRLAYYVNRIVGTYLHLQAMNATKNSTLTIENVGGKPVTMFLGVPVRETDAITNTEAVVV
jgi:hypothetical protein